MNGVSFSGKSKTGFFPMQSYKETILFIQQNSEHPDT